MKTDQEMVRWALEESSEPIIKNPYLRSMFAGGQLVQPGPGRPGYQGKPHYKFSKWKKGVEGKAPMLKKDVREIAKEFKVKEKDFDSFEDFKTRVHSKKREEKRKEKLATDKKYYKKRIEQARKYSKEMKDDPKRLAQRKATEQAYLDKQRETWNILKTERTPKGYLWRDLVENGLRYRKGNLKESHIQLKDVRIKRPKSLDDILNVKLVDLNVLDKNGKPVVLTYDNFIEHIDKNQKRYGMSSKDILTEYDKKIFIHDNPELRDIFNKKMYKTYDPTNLASRRLHSPFHIHHTVGRGKNAFNVQFAEGPLNLKESYSRKSLNANWKGAETLTEKKAAIKTYLDKRPEGLEVRLKKMPYGDRPTFKEQMSKFLKGKELNKIMKSYQTAGIGTKCSVYRAEGGRIGFNKGGYDGCMRNAIQEHNKNLKSNDLTVRNDARAKQFNINKTKNMKSLMSLGARGGKNVLRFGKTWGIELEPIFEGAFYEWGRRKGYTHDQAKEETFFWKMLDPSTKTGLLEGAETLLEKELIGTNKVVQRYVNNEKALYEAQDKYNQLYNDYQVATSGKERNPEKAAQLLKASENAWEEMNRLEDQMDLDQDTYQAAVEKQQTEQGVRAIEYGEYGEGDTELLAKQREKRRQREMEDKFPGYGKADIDKRLEDWGYYIDPNLRSYKGQTVQRPEGLKFLPRTSYDDMSDYIKDQDKRNYFAENFRLEKADGGIVRLLKK